MQPILLGCLNCWNDLDVFRLKKERFFSRLGVFPYHPGDLELMKAKIESQGGLEDSLKVIQENELRVSSISGEDHNLILPTIEEEMKVLRHSEPLMMKKKDSKFLGGGRKEKKTAGDLRKRFGMAFATTVTLNVNKMIKER